jgi:hypothetical protein
MQRDFGFALKVVEPIGFEPTTSSMPWKRSTELSYGPALKQDSTGLPERVAYATLH